MHTRGSCAVIRPGAFGDALQAASIFPALQADGFAVHFYTSAAGEEVCRHDPHVTRIVVFPPDTSDRPETWARIATEHDHVVNLIGAPEFRLLARPHQAEFWWPAHQRRRLFSRSYLSDLHQQAGVPGPYRVAFYPIEEERAWAARHAVELGPIVLIALRGSSPYKWYPHLPEVVCRLLASTPVTIVLTGDAGARHLESAVLDAVGRYSHAPERVRSLVGDKSIRHVMALAQRAPVVVGPETGVLNAVSLDRGVAKVVLLSHSAEANLTADWVRTTALTGAVPCYPCHQLHAGHQTCPQDPVTGAAACAAAIRPDEVVAAVAAALDATWPARSGHDRRDTAVA